MPKKIITKNKPIKKGLLKKTKPKVEVEERKITNKEIAYAYIIRHMQSIRPNNIVIAAIAGAKFRAGGNRLQRISDMILDNASKLTKRAKALLEKRGHADAPFITIDTSTKSAECDTDGSTGVRTIESVDEEEPGDSDGDENDGNDDGEDD